MARERYLIGVNQSELQPPPPPPKPTFWQLLENYWSSYKWLIILGLVFLAGLVYFIVITVTKDTADYSLIMVTNRPLDDITMEEVALYFEDYGEDLNGDGKVIVSVKNYPLNDMRSQAALAAIYMDSSEMFFAFEPECYENQIAPKESETFHFFRKLDVVSPDISEDGRYWDWKNSALKEVSGSYVPDSMYFGVRAPEGVAAGKDELSDRYKALLENSIP